VQIAFNGMLMRPVSRLGEMLSRLAEGDANIDVGDLGKRQDEIGSMARSIETVRKTLVAQKQAQKESI
jgi:HAMP domain-containing protein